ncbi:MAG: DUF3999 family protein [Candidatus Electrothrix sp. AR4]|nr:DUF3999 family protein [Candidatus Electrothrix sp. AR4]
MKLFRFVGRPTSLPYGLLYKTRSLFFLNSLVLIFILLYSSPAYAGDDKKMLQREDFAYGMELSISGRNAIYGLSVPAAIYQGCTKANLSDLRVFNARHLVPHLLRSHVKKKRNDRRSPCLFFPCSTMSKETGGNLLICTSPPTLRAPSLIFVRPVLRGELQRSVPILLIPVRWNILRTG